MKLLGEVADQSTQLEKMSAKLKCVMDEWSQKYTQLI